MYYAPHALFKKIEHVKRDSLNRIVATDATWVYVCDCRCDDNTTQKFEDDNGRVFIPKHKIVCERVNVKEGDYVQCRMKDTLCNCYRVIGEGRVFNAPRNNYLNYMVLYV